MTTNLDFRRLFSSLLYSVFRTHLAPSSQNPTERSTGAQIPDQVLNTAKVSAEELLLLLGGECVIRLAPASTPGAGPPSPAGGGRERTVALTSAVLVTVKGTGEFAGAPLQHGGDGGAGVGGRDRRDLGHEVEVEELDEFELDVARGGAGLEEGGDGEEAVEGLEGAGVGGGVDEGHDEGEEGGGLDGGTVDGFKEVEEELGD